MKTIKTYLRWIFSIDNAKRPFQEEATELIGMAVLIPLLVVFIVRPLYDPEFPLEGALQFIVGVGVGAEIRFWLVITIFVVASIAWSALGLM